MCGIIAGISPKVVDILLLGLKQLQNRGYDSAGITTINNNNFQTTKYASGENSALERLDKERENHEKASIGIAHTRWALLEKDFPVILVAPENKYFAKNMNAYEEIKSRYAKIILVTNKQDLNLPNTILVEKNESYGDLLCIIPLQLLAFKLSLYKGCNADMPRNLAKVVTVE